MARPNESLFTAADKQLEARLKTVINKASKLPKEPGTQKVIDGALEDLSSLYSLIDRRQRK